MILLKRIILLLGLATALTTSVSAQKFSAYYTKINDDYGPTEIAEDQLFGRYADLFVEIGDRGKIRFTRETSYLPVWETDNGRYSFEEVFERSGDGPSDRPDIISKYSLVRLIKNSPEEIIVHWRYFPDFSNVEWDGVVDEYFTISPEGKVLRSIRKGTKKYKDWIDPKNIVYKTYRLSVEGIEPVDYETFQSVSAFEFTPIESIIVDTKNRNPLLKFSFDEGLQNYSESTEGSISGKVYEIKGPHSYWKAGVSGSALHFDGYYSGIEIYDHLEFDEINNFSVEGWVALGAYPFGWAPIIQQSEWGEAGFYFGIDEEGFPGLHIKVNDEWISIVDSNRIDLFKWYHLAAVFNEGNRTVSMYNNGKLSLVEKKPEGSLVLSDSLLTIGLNRQKMPPIEGRVRRGKWPSKYGIDGLIDEVRFYGKAISHEEIKDIYSELDDHTNHVDLAARNMPQVPQSIEQTKFGAHYTTLDYYETWDNLWRVSDHADVVVTFDELPVNIISWRGISYGHYFVTENGKWIGDQSNEDYRLIPHPGEAEGCLEHMSDKQCRHSHVRIIENSDARVVIHWRYGLVDSRYKFAPGVDGWGGWTDEYWTIYPDGVAVRHVPRGIVYGDGWVETMFLSEPGTIPEDNMNLQAFTIMNLDGDVERLTWENDSPESKIDEPILTMVNSKSDYKMLNVFPTGSGIEIFGGHSDRSKFHWWNHWPVSQITSDGRGAKAVDRLAHSSLAWGAPSTNYLMYGITNKPIEDQLILAKSWNHPPELTDIAGAVNAKYVPEERAYHLTCTGSKISLTMEADKESPAVNPAFVFENWQGKEIIVTVNEKRVNEYENYRTGLVDTQEGSNLIIWFKRIYEESTKIEIQH